MSLIIPHGGKLINQFIGEEKTDYSIIVSDDILVDIVNIGNGIYSPISGFLDEKDYLSVLKNIRLDNGTLWPIPIILDITKEQKNEIINNNIKKISLNDKNGNKIAILKNTDIYLLNKEEYCKNIFKTNQLNHPGVKKIHSKNDYLIGGKVSLINNEKKDNSILFPNETRQIFKENGWKSIVAFQTRNPPHVSHEYIQKCALEGCDGLYINPVIGEKKTGDFKDEYIIGAYEILIKNYFNKKNVLFGSLTLNMKYAGPREAILHAIIRQNFGCTHMIIGRDHAGVGDYYGTYEAQEIFDNFGDNDIKIKILKYENSGFCTICKTVTTSKTCPHSDEDKIHISGTKLRKKILNKEILPDDFMRKEISEYLIEGDDQFIG